MAAPNKEQREKCWSAKDEFWKCLESSGDDATKCSIERKNFEGSCTPQWLKYFDRRRDYLKYKEMLEKEEAKKIADDSTS